MNPSGKKLLVAGGGTGGHLFPGLAAAEAWEAAGGKDVLFVGTASGLEAKLIPEKGRHLALLSVGRLKGKGLARRLMTLLGLPRALLQALGIVWRFKPDVVLGVGGFASAPAVAAARLLGIPAALHEQNALPGLANRKLAGLAQRIFTSFEEAASFFPEAKTILTGNPVRPEFRKPLPEIQGSPGQDRPFRLLVFGGSLGAQIFSDVVPQALATLEKPPAGIEVTQQARADGIDDLKKSYASKKIAADVTGFIDDMREAMAQADLVICRAGATSIAELTALGRPALLVPYPYAADDHQTANAKALVSSDGAWLAPQETFTPDWLAQFLEARLENAEALSEAGENARKKGRPDAADRIVEELAQLAGVE